MNQESKNSDLQHDLQTISEKLQTLTASVKTHYSSQLHAQENYAQDNATLLARIDNLEQTLRAEREAVKLEKANLEFARFKSESSAFRTFQVLSLVLTALGLVAAVFIGIWISN